MVALCSCHSDILTPVPSRCATPLDVVCVLIKGAISWSLSLDRGSMVTIVDLVIVRAYCSLLRPG